MTNNNGIKQDSEQDTEEERVNEPEDDLFAESPTLACVDETDVDSEHGQQAPVFFGRR
jgi:hypothetical protein